MYWVLRFSSSSFFFLDVLDPTVLYVDSIDKLHINAAPSTNARTVVGKYGDADRGSKFPDPFEKGTGYLGDV